MADLVRAPWTPEQVTALNRFQREGGMHPFTCGGEHRFGGPTLVAHTDGWQCPATYCDYEQDWAHAFITDPDTPAELTAEEARDLADDLGAQLYRAQDALAFVEECCVIAEREGRAVTVADVRTWLKGAQCGRQLAAGGELDVDPAVPPVHLVTWTGPANNGEQCPRTTADNPPTSSDAPDKPPRGVAVPDWTPPPPGDRREQLPAHLLAAIAIPSYTSTACQTADLLSEAIPDRLDLTKELIEQAGRLHSRCRLNNKYTGVSCDCGCHGAAVAREET